MLTSLGHRPICSAYNQDRSIHLSGTRDHVLYVVSMPGAVDVGVVPVRRCVLLVGGSYCDAALLLLRSVVYLVEGYLAVGRVVWDLLGQVPW